MYLHIVELLSKRSFHLCLARREFQTLTTPPGGEGPDRRRRRGAGDDDAGGDDRHTDDDDDDDDRRIDKDDTSMHGGGTEDALLLPSEEVVRVTMTSPTLAETIQRYLHTHTGCAPIFRLIPKTKLAIYACAGPNETQRRWSCTCGVTPEVQNK